MTFAWIRTLLREEANTWKSSAENISVPTLQQVVTRGKSYTNKIVPLNDEEAPQDLEAARTKQEAKEAFEKECRDIVMESVNSGLINKALISALFLNFNIPSLLSPPASFFPVDVQDPTFLIFFYQLPEPLLLASSASSLPHSSQPTRRPLKSLKRWRSRSRNPWLFTSCSTTTSSSCRACSHPHK